MNSAGDLAEWLRRSTRNRLGFPARVQISQSSVLGFSVGEERNCTDGKAQQVIIESGITNANAEPNIEPDL